MHHLKLLVRDSQLDARFLAVTDISEYDSGLPVKNNTLYIQLPGFANPVEVLLTIKGTVSYSTKSLGLSQPGAPLGALPDGIYTLTYSVSPNSKVHVVQYHYRTALLEQRLYAKIADLQGKKDVHAIDACGNIEWEKHEKTLAYALLTLEGLKGSILGKGDVVQADCQYQEVEWLLENLKSGYC